MLNVKFENSQDVHSIVLSQLNDNEFKLTTGGQKYWRYVEVDLTKEDVQKLIDFAKESKNGDEFILVKDRIEVEVEIIDGMVYMALNDIEPGKADKRGCITVGSVHPSMLI